MSSIDLKLREQIMKASDETPEDTPAQLVYLLKERKIIASKILKPHGLYSESEKRETVALFEYVQNKIRWLLAL